VATFCLVNPQQTLVTCLVKITLPNKKTGTANKKICSTNSFKKHTLQNATSYEQLAQAWSPMLLAGLIITGFKIDQAISNWIKSGKIRSKQVISHQITSNQIKSDQIESNRNR
jgi:hypothetical protein